MEPQAPVRRSAAKEGLKDLFPHRQPSRSGEVPLADPRFSGWSLRRLKDLFLNRKPSRSGEVPLADPRFLRQEPQATEEPLSLPFHARNVAHELSPMARRVIL